MPGRDGTGPRGEGPRTGGGRGNCPPSDSSNDKTASRSGPGRGLRLGRVRRKGLGRYGQRGNLQTS